MKIRRFYRRVILLSCRYAIITKIRRWPHGPCCDEATTRITVPVGLSVNPFLGWLIACATSFFGIPSVIEAKVAWTRCLPSVKMSLLLLAFLRIDFGGPILIFKSRHFVAMDLGFESMIGQGR